MVISILLLSVSIVCAVIGIWAIFNKLLPLLAYVANITDDNEPLEKKQRMVNHSYRSFCLICSTLGVISVSIIVLNSYLVEKQLWGKWILLAFIVLGAILGFTISHKISNLLANKNLHTLEVSFEKLNPIMCIIVSFGGVIYNIIYFVRCLILGLF
ncbi:MAG: hypothetical protein IJX87_01845 [Clostridia bacterium]|nr:hypothetical protein [Clostridia bacterium]